MQNQAFHEDFTREEKVKGSSDRTFGLTFAGVFTLLACLAFWKHTPHWTWWAALAVITFIFAVLRPQIFKPANKLWMLLGLMMFKVVSPLTLGIIFYGVMTPMAILFRWRKKDLLKLEYKHAEPTYWILRQPPGPPPETMKNQF
jgi:hypothetical protein